MAKGINYRQLTLKAFRALLAEVLTQVAREGLPGKHHFFITFDTTHPGVDMNPALRTRYPKEMTVVMQDWFSDLAVMYGIRRWGNEELRQMWKADLDRQIAALGLAVPDAGAGRRIH